MSNVFVVESGVVKEGRKIATIQHVDESVAIRRPVSSLKQKYVPKVNFLPHEVSNKLSDELNHRGIDWFDVTTFDHNQLGLWIQFGYEFEGEPWRVLFALWKDNKGKAICVPMGCGIRTIKDIGCFTHMESLDDSMKAAKYINRHFAPLKMGEEYFRAKLVEGGIEEADEKGNFEAVFEFLHTGDQIVVKYNNLKTMTPEQVSACDGHLDYSEHFAEVMARLGCVIKHGQSWTIASSFGMGKGHSRLIRGLEPDLVIHGPKSIYTIDGFEFGVRADLHPGSPHTDIFSIFNFQFDREFMLPPLVDEFLKHVWEASHSELGTKKMYIGSINIPTDLFATSVDELVQRAYEQEDAFSLLRYLKRGASPFAMPWMYRKIERHILTEVVQAKEGCVPMEYAPGKGVAISRYVAGDIYSVMPDGSINMANSVIPQGFCVCMDLPAGIKLAIYRQPNAHQGEHVILTNMHHPAYEFARGGVYIYMGHGEHEVAPILGGMDNDDALIIVHNANWVRGFEELAANPYPVFGPLISEEEKKAQVMEEADSSFYEDLMGFVKFNPDDIKDYSDQHALHQIEMITKSGAGIGPVSNAILQDTAMSIPRYKTYIARWLKSRGQDADIDILANRPDYQMNKLATHLELVIDGNVKDRALLSALGNTSKQVSDFHEAASMYAVSLEGKIPAKKKTKGDYMLVETPVCAMLWDIDDRIRQLLEAFKTNEWQLVRAADKEVLKAYPSSKEIRLLVHGQKPVAGIEVDELEPGLLTIWKREWQEAFANGQMEDEDQAKYMRSKIVDLIMNFMEPVHEFRKEIAVELYRHYYKGRKAQAAKDQAGNRRNYPDGLFGMNYFANALLDALEDIGMTGNTYSVDFDRYAGFMRRVQLKVKVNNGIVYQSKDMKAIGLCLMCPNGEYPMVGGLITSREAHDCLQSPDHIDHELEMDMEVAAEME